MLALVEQRSHRRRAASQLASDGDLLGVPMELFRLTDQRLAAFQGRLQFLFDVIEPRDAPIREVVDARQSQQLGLQVAQSLPRGPDSFDVRVAAQRFLNLRASRLQFGQLPLVMSSQADHVAVAVQPLFLCLDLLVELFVPSQQRRQRVLPSLVPQPIGVVRHLVACGEQRLPERAERFAVNRSRDIVVREVRQFVQLIQSQRENLIEQLFGEIPDDVRKRVGQRQRRRFGFVKRFFFDLVFDLEIAVLDQAAAVRLRSVRGGEPARSDQAAAAVVSSSANLEQPAAMPDLQRADVRPSPRVFGLKAEQHAANEASQGRLARLVRAGDDRQPFAGDRQRQLVPRTKLFDLDFSDLHRVLILVRLVFS